jgi:tRNA(Arg) A34 adenosine deaminase TadA
MRPYDLDFLLLAIQTAADARAHGNHPFGALLVDDQGRLLLTAENSVVTGHDVTAHAETNLVRLAGAANSKEELRTCTLYTSTEPCAMCSGAIFWCGIGRVVYALSEHGLLDLVAHLPPGDFLNLPCREVFARGDRATEVLGPLLEEQARQVHMGFW